MNSTPTSRTDVTSRGHYSMLAVSAGADRPCEHLNSCDIIIIIITDIILCAPRARTLCGLYLSTLTIQFLHPRSSIPHLCVSHTDSQRDQLTKYPGLLYHSIPAFTNPLILSSQSNLPHTIKPSIKPPTYQHIATTQCHDVVAIVSSSAKTNRLLLKSLASRFQASTAAIAAAIASVRPVCLDSGKQAKDAGFGMSNIIKFPPNTRLTAPVSALQQFFPLHHLSRVLLSHLPRFHYLPHSLVTHVAQGKKRMQHVHRTGSSHAMKQGVFVPAFLLIIFPRIINIAITSSG
jgi:hypothetical protein